MMQVKKKRNIWVIIGIFLIFALPMIAAFISYLERDKLNLATTNYGEFVTPVLSITDLGIDIPVWDPDEGTSPFGMHWWLAYVTAQPCGDRCQQHMTKIHSVQLALGRDFEQLQPLLLAPEVQADADWLDMMQATWVQPRSSAINRLTQTTTSSSIQSNEDKIFIIDPAGHFVLVYAADAEGPGMLRDIRQLLQVSSHG